MKNLEKLAKGCVLFSLFLFFCLFVAGCGGGGGDSSAKYGGGAGGGSNDNPPIIIATVPSVASLDAAKATLNVQMDKTTYQPAMVGDFFVHLSDGTKEVFVDKKNVTKIFLNGDGVGWHASDPTKGINLAYDGSVNPVFSIGGQPLSPVFGINFSFLTNDGRELAQITDAKWLNIIVGTGMLAERKADGLIYGSAVVVAPVSGPSVAELDAAKATLNVQTDKATFQPAMVGDYFVHLSDGTKEVFVDRKNVTKIFLNGDGVGWHSADPTKGINLAYNGSANPVFIMAGQRLSASFGINFSFVVNDGRELSQITDAKWFTIVVGSGMTAERKTDGLLYGSAVVIAPPPPPVVVPATKTVVNVNTLTGEVEVTPVIVSGKLVNLVSSNPEEKVLDVNNQVIAGYRIAWNDNGSWYPAGGKVSALLLPKTTLTQAAKPVGTGAGMPYLVRPDGTFVSFNTDPLVCTFTVNGVLTKINIDGLMPY